MEAHAFIQRRDIRANALLDIQMTIVKHVRMTPSLP